MAKKLTRPGPVTAPDLLQQLRDRIKLARPNDGTWDAMDGGKMTPMKLAVAMILWSGHKCLKDAGIDSPLTAKRAIGVDLWAAVEKIRQEDRIADIEELVRDKEDGHEPKRGCKWVEAVLSVEPPKRPDHICSECRVQVGGNTASCAGCHDWDGLWRAIEEVRSKRIKLRTKLKCVLEKHSVPLEYLDRIARIPHLAAEFHEQAIVEEARTKVVRDEGERNLKAVKNLRLALQGSDELKSVFRRHGCSPTSLLRELPGIETDFAAEIARVIEPTDARQATLKMLSIRLTPGRPVSVVGRQRDFAIDELFTIWVEVHGKEPSVHPTTAGGSTPFVELLKDTFCALGRDDGRDDWVEGVERAAARVKRERRAWRNATAT